MATVILDDVQMKETKRAQRRHDVERVKAARAQHMTAQPLDGRPSDKTIGKLANTAAPCSCAMCGNPRKFHGELTMQERRLMQEDPQD